MRTINNHCIVMNRIVLMLLVLGTVEAQAATFTVINTNDTGVGSLERAIIDANNNPGLDNIVFDIPGPGPHTILSTFSLPTITDPVIIDVYNQPSASTNSSTLSVEKTITLMIDLNGTS